MLSLALLGGALGVALLLTIRQLLALLLPSLPLTVHPLYLLLADTDTGINNLTGDLRRVLSLPGNSYFY